MAFQNCTGLLKVNAVSLSAWCNITFDGNSANNDICWANPLYFAKRLFINNEEVVELIIPEGVTTINTYAFVNLENVTKISIASTVTKINSKAFVGLTGVNNIEFVDTTGWKNSMSTSMPTSAVSPTDMASQEYLKQKLITQYFYYWEKDN